MKCYVIKTSNNKYLKYNWEDNFEGGEICVLRETAELSYCSRFNEYTLDSFIDIFDSDNFKYGYEGFTLSHIEEVITNPITLENLDL